MNKSGVVGSADPPEFTTPVGEVREVDLRTLAQPISGSSLPPADPDTMRSNHGRRPQRRSGSVGAERVPPSPQESVLGGRYAERQALLPTEGPSAAADCDACPLDEHGASSLVGQLRIARHRCAAERLAFFVRHHVPVDARPVAQLPAPPFLRPCWISCSVTAIRTGGTLRSELFTRVQRRQLHQRVSRERRRWSRCAATRCSPQALQAAHQLRSLLRGSLRAMNGERQ